MNINNSNPYYRRSTILQESIVEYKNSVANTADVQKLSRTLLKAVQDYMYDWRLQKNLKEAADILSESLIEKYRKLYIENKIEQLKKSTVNNEPTLLEPNTITLSHDKIRKKAEVMYALEERNIRYAAKLKAWKEVIRPQLDQKYITSLTFEANEILEYANISNSNSEWLFKMTKSVQYEFNQWIEPVFDEELKEVVNREFNATLFPTSYLERRGKGKSNRINLAINPDMAHLIIFLSGKYLSFHLEISNKLGNKIQTRLYEMLIESINPDRSGKAQWNYKKVCKRWKINGSNTSQTIRRNIGEPLKAINKALDTEITYETIKEGRKIIGWEFIISKIDKAALQGKARDKAIYDENQTKSFEYYLALMQYNKGLIDIENIFDYSIMFEERLASGELEPEKEIYEAYKKNIKDFLELQELEKNRELPSGYKIDERLLVVTNEKKGIPIKPTATECLELINDPKFIEQNMEMRIEEFFPFQFISINNEITIKKSNYKKYKKLVDVAIRYKDEKLFQFENEEMKTKFNKHILKMDNEIKEEGNTLFTTASPVKTTSDTAIIEAEVIKDSIEIIEDENDRSKEPSITELLKDITINVTHDKKQTIEIIKGDGNKIELCFTDGGKYTIKIDNSMSISAFKNKLLNDIISIAEHVPDERIPISAFAQRFLSNMRQDNKDFQIGKEKEWNDLFEKMFEKSNYGAFEYLDIVDAITDYLMQNKDGRKFYLNHLKSAQWFETKWENISVKVMSRYNDIKLSKAMNQQCLCDLHPLYQESEQF